jgi:hypothetical protein
MDTKVASTARRLRSTDAHRGSRPCGRAGEDPAFPEVIVCVRVGDVGRVATGPDTKCGPYRDGATFGD